MKSALEECPEPADSGEPPPHPCYSITPPGSNQEWGGSRDTHGRTRIQMGRKPTEQNVGPLFPIPWSSPAGRALGVRGQTTPLCSTRPKAPARKQETVCSTIRAPQGPGAATLLPAPTVLNSGVRGGGAFLFSCPSRPQSLDLASDLDLLC